jgi:RNA polymerase sigma-70 factor, ECF subfamily
MEVGAIYHQFHHALLGFIRSKIRSKEDAEDILQNVFIRISSNVESLSNEEKLTAWMFTITRNAIIDYYRKNGAKPNFSGDEELENTSEIIDSDSTKGLDQCVGSMIELLPADYREIILDTEIKGARQKDLVEKYGIAYSSIRSRVQRGREKLKQLFYNCCHIEADRRGNIVDVQPGSGCARPCNPCSSAESEK